ncbi:MAG: LON peptidase substrate-binding domain-containing protein [Planctomycetaceae bacterium]
MLDPDDSLTFSADGFSGISRVFPLPNVVMFPHVMQPLHIFEPRYRAMLEEAVAEDRLIALGMLAPGWESNHEDRPPLMPTACLCRVATHKRTEGGTYNVLMLGVRRVRLTRELPPLKPFREFHADILDDIVQSEGDSRANQLQKRLLTAFKAVLPKISEASEQLDQLLGNQITLGMLSDIVSYTVDIDIESKLRLLAECDVIARSSMLIDEIAGRAAGLRQRTFPPEFSSN